MTVCVCVTWVEDFCPEVQTGTRRRPCLTLTVSLGQCYTRPAVQWSHFIQAVLCYLPSPGCICDEEGGWQWPWGLSALRSVGLASESPRKTMAVTLRAAGRSVPWRWSCCWQKSVQQQLPASTSRFYSISTTAVWALKTEVWINGCDSGSHLKSWRLCNFHPHQAARSSFISFALLIGALRCWSNKSAALSAFPSLITALTNFYWSLRKAG